MSFICVASSCCRCLLPIHHPDYWTSWKVAEVSLSRRFAEVRVSRRVAELSRNHLELGYWNCFRKSFEQVEGQRNFDLVEQRSFDLVKRRSFDLLKQGSLDLVKRRKEIQRLADPSHLKNLQVLQSNPQIRKNFRYLLKQVVSWRT